VAYREARQVAVDSAYTLDFSAPAVRERGFTGFLTVGELANVRGFDADTGSAASNKILYGVTSGKDGMTYDERNDYLGSIALLVSLGDWMSTRSHVFTVYGTLRGSGPKSAADQTAIRFQETVDRLPTLFNNDLPNRVGQRIISTYMDARGD
jgi:hypothetical protein